MSAGAPKAEAKSGIGLLVRRLERAFGAAAALLLELRRIERAVQLREALEVRSGRALRRHAGRSFGRRQFVGLAPAKRLLFGLEGHLAGACGDVDIAGPADDLVGGDRNLALVGKVGVAFEECGNRMLVGSRQRRVLRDYAGKRERR